MNDILIKAPFVPHSGRDKPLDSNQSVGIIPRHNFLIIMGLTNIEEDKCVAFSLSFIFLFLLLRMLYPFFGMHIFSERHPERLASVAGAPSNSIWSQFLNKHRKRKGGRRKEERGERGPPHRDVTDLKLGSNMSRRSRRGKKRERKMEDGWVGSRLVRSLIKKLCDKSSSGDEGRWRRRKSGL